ncbi:ABC transporter ATP-binding protein [Chloroflexi bacterium TSY]|nr:ABC transporter ATP-binding protein [Chloroflexi bacterium TSY]
MKVKLINLSKRWGDVYGAKGIDLEIQDGEFVAFLGPSGCGKTTTLLMVAGIYKPSEGEIFFNDRLVNQVAPKDRNIGMVFQSYALYPHMSVFQNISYPLKLKKRSRAEMQERTQRVAKMMGIDDLLDRKPGQLSGGQQQRVALGRALVKEPGLLLFDEPLSNLDARLRLTMRSEIKRLQLELGITSIYVTHDQVEAMTMADRIAVMKDGQLQAFDTPAELYEKPRTLFIGGFVGNPPMNFIEVEVRQDAERFIAQRGLIQMPVTAEQGSKVAGRGSVVLGVRPEDITILTEETSETQWIGDTTTKAVIGEVAIVEPLGRDNLIDVVVDDLHIHVLSNPAHRLRINDRVQLQVNPEKVQFFDPTTEKSLLWSDHLD